MVFLDEIVGLLNLIKLSSNDTHSVIMTPNEDVNMNLSTSTVNSIPTLNQNPEISTVNTLEEGKPSVQSIVTLNQDTPRTASTYSYHPTKVTLL